METGRPEGADRPDRVEWGNVDSFRLLAENAPDFVRERIIPRFIEYFNEASGGS